MSKLKLVALKPFVGANITYPNLRKLNMLAAGLFLVQGLAILLLANPSRGVESIVTTFLTKDTLASSAAGHTVLVSGTHHLFDIELAYLVAAFLFIGALAHYVVANDLRKRYEKGLKQGINKMRWIEYAFSAGIMMVGIGLLSGIFDFSALLMLGGLTAVMSLLGLVMEIHNQTTAKTNWLSFRIGLIAEALVWVVIVIYMLGAVVYGSSVANYVYFIYGSLFILFNLFALNMYLHYKKAGKWANYLYAERGYIVLSLVAKSALAWQIFAGTLR